MAGDKKCQSPAMGHALRYHGIIQGIEVEISQMLLIEREQTELGGLSYVITTEKKQVSVFITKYYVQVFAGAGVGTGKVFHHDGSVITALAKAYDAYKCKHCKTAIHAVFAELTEAA